MRSEVISYFFTGTPQVLPTKQTLYIEMDSEVLDSIIVTEIQV